jgi:hypothetical protein
MSFSRSTDVVIAGLRSTLGSTLLVGSETAYIRRAPETDLYALPLVTATNYPLVAIEDVSDDANAEPDFETARQMSVGVTLAMHYVARIEDVTSGAIATPREYCRKCVEAIDAKIGAAPALGTSIIGKVRWRGGGQELSAAEDLRAQGLCEHTTVWQFSYGADRP